MKLIHGDCLEEMAKIPDKSIDLVLTDIPYSEVNRDSNGLRNLNKDKADIITFDLTGLLQQSVRVCKGSIYIFCGINQISSIRMFLSDAGMTTRVIVWEKSNPSPMNGDKVWLSGVEFCVYGKFPKATYNQFCRNCVLKYPSGKNKVHPTEKNLKLFIDIVKTSSNEGDLVLDCCMGSGTTGVACVNTDRDFIGIELNEEYFKIAERRINDAIAEKESKLF